MIDTLCELYEVRLLAESGFLMHMQEEQWAQVSWNEACTAQDVQLGITPSLLKLVRPALLSVLHFSRPLLDHAQQLTSLKRDQDDCTFHYEDLL